MIDTEEARRLRRDLQRGSTTQMNLRRAIISASVVGAASMVPVTLLQTGIVHHLPDPPIKGFHSDAANSWLIAYKFGVPDGPMSVASFAINVPLAAFGGHGRIPESRDLRSSRHHAGRHVGGVIRHRRCLSGPGLGYYWP
jgi:hypothetical protein